MIDPQSPHKIQTAMNHQLWIDGVGGFLLCTKPTIAIGSGDTVDFAIRAPISRHHATLEFADDHWVWWEVQDPTRTTQVLTRDFQELQLSHGVALGFSQPHPWSQTAFLDLRSSHRSQLGVDGCVLMSRECLIGPTADCHIQCRDWTETIVLSRTMTEFQWHRLADVRPGSQTLSKQRLPIDETLTLKYSNSDEVQIRLENLEFSKVD